MIKDSNTYNINYSKRNMLLVCVIVTHTLILSAQEAIANYGNFKIHPTAQVGFHIDVINDGTSNNNNGFVGFYNQNDLLNISGLNEMNFEDIEIDVIDDLYVYTSIGVSNDVQFTSGRVITDRNTPTTQFKFLDNNLYTGSSNTNHIDGYAQYSGNFGFVFPIGDDFELKPLEINNNNPTYEFEAALFIEDPNTPSTFPTSFDTTNFEPSLDIISNTEFWYFKGIGNVDVTLNWTSTSNVNLLASTINDLRITAWNPTLQQWINLGNSNVTGDLNNGSITTQITDSENYSIYTIGSILKAGNEALVYNAITPDGDGHNDTLIIRGIEGLTNNQLSIFNRWGALVYQKDNYDNSFNGISDGRGTVQANQELPSGTYFYILKIDDQEDLKGYFYINR